MILMIPEIYHDALIVSSLIGDRILDIEWNIKRVNPSDSQFTQLSNEKFALGTVLEQILLRDEPPEVILEEFIDYMTEMMCETQDTDAWNLYATGRTIIENIFVELYKEENH